MNKQPIKRKYQVEFNDYVKMCVEGAKQDVYACYGWHDLIDHTHGDEVFEKLDPSSNSYLEAGKVYRKKFQSLLKRTVTKLYEQKNLKLLEYKKQIKYLEDFCKSERKRVERAIKKAEAKRIRKEKGGLLDAQDELQKLKKVLREIEDEAYEIVYAKLGDEPDYKIYWQPILDRGCWQFEYVSFTIPTWIQDREYRIISEIPVDMEKNITKLERVEPKGSGINWKSRNRGGGVRHKNFDKAATKIYPNHLNSGI
jgi:hypothetical protein